MLNNSSAVSTSGDDAKQLNLGNNLQQVIHDKKKDTAQSNHSIKLDDRHCQMGGNNDSASPAAAMFMARMFRVNQVQLMQVAKPVPVSKEVGAFTSKDHPQDIPMSSKVVKPTNASAGVASKAGCYKLGMGNEINTKHTNPSPSKRMNGESSTYLGVGIRVEIPKAAASKPVLDVEGNPIELNPNDVILSFTNDFYKATLFARFRELKEKKEKIEVKIEANAMIQFFKKRGGRLVKLVKHVRYEEVNDEVALTSKYFFCLHFETNINALIRL